MTVKERILAIRILEKERKNSDYFKKIGVQTIMIKKNENSIHKEGENKNVQL